MKNASTIVYVWILENINNESPQYSCSIYNWEKDSHLPTQTKIVKFQQTLEVITLATKFLFRINKCEFFIEHTHYYPDVHVFIKFEISNWEINNLILSFLTNYPQTDQLLEYWCFIWCTGKWSKYWIIANYV